jgi:glycerol-3-phosphate acyltransferase PlsY
MRSPSPRPAQRSLADRSGNIWGQNVPVRPKAPCFGFTFLYSFWIFSFCYFLLFLLSVLISYYSSLLILLFLPLLILLVGASATVFFVFLFLSSYILNCLLYYRHAN